jgi:hypothetical protein
MRERLITIPEIGLVAGTRAMLGAGIALLLADRLPIDSRRAIGWTLIAVGAITTVPLAMEILGRKPISALGAL